MPRSSPAGHMQASNSCSRAGRDPFRKGGGVPGTAARITGQRRHRAMTAETRTDLRDPPGGLMREVRQREARSRATLQQPSTRHPQGARCSGPLRSIVRARGLSIEPANPQPKLQ